MDITKYLYRIRYTGSLTPTKEVLADLQLHHLLNVPFENLDIHYQNPIYLDLEKIYSKIIDEQRGGFCYELNGLFFELLISLGFNAKRISARVFDSKKNDYGKEFDHLAIIVEIQQNEYLVDVGFGDFTFNPLHLKLNEIQNDQRGDFIIEKYKNEYYKVSKLIDGKWQPEYIFSPETRELKEFGGMCTYHQTSPYSHFTQKRLITKPSINGRVTITGDQLKITENEKVILQKSLTNKNDWQNHLKSYFGIDEIILKNS